MQGRAPRGLSALLALLAGAPALAQGALTPPVLLEPPSAELPPGTVYPAPEVAVVLALELTRTGTVSRAEVVEGAGEPFDAAALAAGARLRFEPARLPSGEAVPVSLRFRVRMQAPPPPEPPPPPPEPRVLLELTLLERGTRRPVAARVFASRGAEPIDEVDSDAQGRVRLQVPTSTFSIAVDPAEHEPLELEARGGDEPRTYYLARAANAYAVDVRGKVRTREVTRRAIAAEEVRRLPGTQGDTLKVVQNLPGVARPSFGGGPLVLRGATPGDSRTFLEGQEIPQIFHFGGLRSTFAARFLEAVELVPGNFGPDYGRAIGGVVDVRVRDPASDLFRGEVDLNFFDAGFALEGPIGETLSIGGGFRRSYIDSILPAVIPDDAPVSFDVAPRYYDYQLLAAWRQAPAHKLRAFFYGALDRLELLFADPATDPKVRGTLSARTMFHAVQVESQGRLLDGALREETSVKLGLNELDFLLGPDFFFDLGVQTVSLRSAWTYRASESLGLRFGTDSRVQWVQIALTSPSPPKEGESPVPVSTQRVLGVSRDLALVEPALFVELSWRPVEGLELLPSLRLDYYEAIDRATLDPRLSARYALGERWSLSGGLGLHQQQPQYDESDPLTGTATLLAPRSLQASLGVEHRPIGGMSLELTGFYKALDRVVSRGVGPGAPNFTNDGTGRIFGLELLVRATFPGVFQGWLSYTFQRSFRTDRPGEPERVFDFDQPHILTLLGTYEIGAGWSAGARFRLVSGNPSAPVLDSIYDAYADVFVPVFGPKSERLGTFHQLDLRVDKEWVFEEWKLGLYLDVQNTYNHANQEGWRYKYDYRVREPVTGLPILPVLGVRGDW